MKHRLPFQPLPADLPVIVWPLPYATDDSARQHHRHHFYMLLWVTAGTGRHQVNFRDVNLQPGRVLFVREGLAHRILTQPDGGWLILFKPDLFHRFLRHHPQEEQHGLFDQLDDQPFIDLDEKTVTIFTALLPLLAAQASHNPLDALAGDYLAILLHTANRLHRPLHPRQIHPAQAETMRQLKMLIEGHYLEQRHTSFYAERLNIHVRKLNKLARQLTGHSVDELVEWRIIAEAEALLGGSQLTIKEIAFELGFLNQSHFGYFFRRRKGISSKEFRKRMREGL